MSNYFRSRKNRLPVPAATVTELLATPLTMFQVGFVRLSVLSSTKPGTSVGHEIASWLPEGIADREGTAVGASEYSPKSSMPKYQLSLPAWANRTLTLAWLSACGRRNHSTRLDSIGSSLTRALR